MNCAAISTYKSSHTDGLLLIKFRQRRQLSMTDNRKNTVNKYYQIPVNPLRGPYKTINGSYYYNILIIGALRQTNLMAKYDNYSKWQYCLDALALEYNRSRSKKKSDMRKYADEQNYDAGLACIKNKGARRYGSNIAI